VRVAVPVADVRRDLGFGELAHDRTEVLVVLAQLEHRVLALPASRRCSRLVVNLTLT